MHLNISIAQKGVNIGLHNAIELLHIPVKKQFHNAFNDACYTVEVFKKIYNKDINLAFIIQINI
ncbi:hypothetical protein [Clostridium magnum]|uniref:hypothetical protein n=1 Tax=Clostridium magnum TaxID=33954 RepID=UPI000B139FDB